MDRTQVEAREASKIINDLKNRLVELLGMTMALRDMQLTDIVPSEDFINEMASYADYAVPHMCDGAGE